MLPSVMRDPRPGLPWSTARVARREHYGTYMRSPAWLHRREAWEAAWTSRHGAAPTCAACGGEWNLSHGDVHHRSYDRLGSEIYEDLIALCRPCHTQLHTLMDGSPAWRRLPRAQTTDLLVARIRAAKAKLAEQ